MQMSSYDLNSGKREVLPEMKYARRQFCPILVGKYIYVFGGYGAYDALGCEINIYSYSTLNLCER